MIEINAIEFQKNLNDMLNQVQHGNSFIIIDDDGKPIAGVVDVELFFRIRRMRTRFDVLSDQIAKTYICVDEAEGMIEIDAAVARERLV